MYPQYLFEYPNIDSEFPFYFKKKSYTSIPPHRHDFIEFSFVLKGLGYEYINGVKHDMKPGTMVLLLPYQIHRYDALPGHTLSMYVCNFNMELLTEGAESAWGLREFILSRNFSRAAYVQLTGEAYNEGLRIWNSLHQEYEGSLAWKPIILKALLLEALTLFARNGGLQAAKDDAAEDQLTLIKNRSIWTIVQYVHHHYLENLTLDTLSKRFQLHPTQLSSMFTKQYGIHFVDFLHELRIRHACSLLLTSDMPITQIAFESGFTSYPTFSRAFLKIKGTTPRHYRKERGGYSAI